MRLFIKIVSVLVLLIAIVACGRKAEEVFLEKDGKEYKVGEQASFYYPKDFELKAASDNNKVVNFVKNDEMISYSTIKDDTDNAIDDMPTLYAGQLEEDGAKNVAFKNIEIDSGLKCQEFTGSYVSTGISFKHMVYFTDEATYVLMYQAPQETYDENISVVSKYLESLAVHHEQVS